MAKRGRWLKNVNGTWHYLRRVPKGFADVDPRVFAQVSLGTGDFDLAERLKIKINAATEARWAALRRGVSPEIEERYRAAIDRARLEGFEYRTAADLAEGDLGELMARLEALLAQHSDALTRDDKPAAPGDRQAAEALLGLLSQPKLTISAALEEYFEAVKDRHRDKSKDQMRRWKAPRRRAVAQLTEITGDKPLQEVTRADALALRAWWVERVIEEGYAANSANKVLGQLGHIFDTLNDRLELGMGRPFAGLRLDDKNEATRDPFEPAWIRDQILAPGALSGMNDEARLIVLALVETGLRPNEACGLEPDDIRLDGPVPHLVIRNNKTRALKTPYSERQIPLVGVSLEAMREAPLGFPRYADRSSQLSAAVNKYLRTNDLLPSESHSLYSLRHSFQDRLTAADMPDRVQTELMGHKFDRPIYGRGPSLEHKRDWLIRVAVSLSDDEKAKALGPAPKEAAGAEAPADR